MILIINNTNLSKTVDFNLNPTMSVAEKTIPIWLPKLYLFLSHDKVKFFSLLNFKNVIYFPVTFSHGIFL